MLYNANWIILHEITCGQLTMYSVSVNVCLLRLFSKFIDVFSSRVRAVNKAGPGEPSDSTHPIVAKPRNLAPKIDRTNLIDIKIKVGQKFGFDVKVSC